MDLNIDTAALKRVAIEAGRAGLPFLEQALSAALVGVAGPFGMLVSPALNLLFPQINTMLGLEARCRSQRHGRQDRLRSGRRPRPRSTR